MRDPAQLVPQGPRQRDKRQGKDPRQTTQLAACRDRYDRQPVEQPDLPHFAKTRCMEEIMRRSRYTRWSFAYLRGTRKFYLCEVLHQRGQVTHTFSSAQAARPTVVQHYDFTHRCRRAQRSPSVTQYFLAVAVRNGESPIFISKGPKVLYSTYSMHRRRDIWDTDADEFRPEHWVGARHSWVRKLLFLLNGDLKRPRNLLTASDKGIPPLQWRPENVPRSTIRHHGNPLHYHTIRARVSKYRGPRRPAVDRDAGFDGDSGSCSSRPLSEVLKEDC